MHRDDYKKRIQQHYDKLSKAEKRLADLITSLPGSPIGYSATELAKLAKVSKSITSRLFRSLGYQGFGEFRDELRRTQNWGSPAFFDVETASGNNDDHMMSAHIQQDILNLQKTFTHIDPAILEQAIEGLRKARRVYICGFRNSYILASYLSRQLILLRDNVEQLPHAGQTLGDDLIDMNDQDVLVMIGLRRRVPQVIKLMKFAKKLNSNILYITDPRATRTAQLATWCFKVEVHSDTPFDSYVGIMSLMNLISARIFRCDIENGFKRIHLGEDRHDMLNELDTYKLKEKTP